MINKNRYNLLILIFIISFLSSSIIAIDSIGTFSKDSCVRIPQTCASCTYVNLSSVSFPNTTVAISNVEMTDAGNGEWYYTFCNTTDLGRYDIRGKGDKEGDDTSFATYFLITVNGTESTTAESILYSLFIVILIFILMGLFYFILTLPSDNDRDRSGTIIGIIKLKYLRILLIAIVYPLLILILNLMNGLAVNYSDLTIFSGTIGFIFELMLRASWVFTIIIIIWIIYLLIHDSNAKKNLAKIGRFRING